MGDHPWKRGQTRAKGEVPLHKIDYAGKKGAQDERQQHPILNCDVGGKRKKIEPNIVAVERIALSVGRLPDEAEGNVPGANLAQGDKGGEGQGARNDQETPRKTRRQALQRRR